MKEVDESQNVRRRARALTPGAQEAWLLRRFAGVLLPSSPSVCAFPQSRGSPPLSATHRPPSQMAYLVWSNTYNAVPVSRMTDMVVLNATVSPFNPTRGATADFTVTIINNGPADGKRQSPATIYGYMCESAADCSPQRACSSATPYKLADFDGDSGTQRPLQVGETKAFTCTNVAIPLTAGAQASFAFFVDAEVRLALTVAACGGVVVGVTWAGA